jgi:hypothetical protein
MTNPAAESFPHEPEPVPADPDHLLSDEADIIAKENEVFEMIDTMGRTGRSLEEIRDDPHLNFRLGEIAGLKARLAEQQARDALASEAKPTESTEE